MKGSPGGNEFTPALQVELQAPAGRGLCSSSRADRYCCNVPSLVDLHLPVSLPETLEQIRSRSRASGGVGLSLHYDFQLCQSLERALGWSSSSGWWFYGDEWD